MFPQADLSNTLRHIPWFAELTPAQLDRLASIATLHELQPNETLFHEGDREDALFILLEGQMALELEVPTRGKVEFYTAEMLDIIGWESLTPIARQRTSDARARKHCLVLGFNSKLLQQMCDEDHKFGYVIMRKLANVVANRLLTVRLALLDKIAHPLNQAASVP